MSSCIFLPQERNPPIYLAQPPYEDFEDYVLGYTGDTFHGDHWERKYSVEANRMTVIWTSQKLGAVAQMNYQDNRNESTSPKEYYSDENIEFIFFGQYQHLMRMSSCEKISDGITLSEYSGELNSVPFTIKFWTITPNQSYFMDFSLIFPKSYSSQMEYYASLLFPSLSRCQGETVLNINSNLR